MEAGRELPLDDAFKKITKLRDASKIIHRYIYLDNRIKTVNRLL